MEGETLPPLDLDGMEGDAQQPMDLDGMEGDAQPLPACVSKVLDDGNLLTEVIVRVGFPVSLVRAAGVCRRWLSHASDRAFLRRFRELHPPRLLGFYLALGGHTAAEVRFFPMPPRPLEPAAVIRRENFSLGLRNTWYTNGVSVVSDGWTNVKGKPLINVIASNSRGSMFLYAQDFSGIEKTGEAIAEFLLQAIDEIGPANVLQVVTDNAANCRLAGKEITKVHKHIFWSPCVVHTLNLIFKDLADKFPWMVETCEEGKAIGSYFRDHQHCQALFRDNSQLDLLRVAKTRFASNYIVLRRLCDVREALATTVVTSRWKDLLKACDAQGRTKATAIAQSINSERFWDNVDAFLAMTKPLFLVIKFSDGEGPKIGDVYERMDNMLGEIQDVMTEEDNPRKEDWPAVNEIVIKRWGKMNWTLHCLAFALSPKYYDHAYLATPAPGGVTRKAPNQDKEVMVAVIDALKSIAEDGAEHKLLREEFNTFITKKGIFALAAVQADAVTMNAIDWWFNYGSETPHLAEVAKKVLSQPISSSSAERNWSTYSYVHNVKRNRMNTKSADKLVYVHSNERLKRRFSESYKEGPHYKWDIDPENSLLEESNVRLEKMRWKGLEGNNDNPTFDDAPEPSRKIKKTRK